jgi:hypothetical protein
VIPFTSITRLAGGKWRFDWVPTGADLYRVVLNGLFIQSIDAPPLDLGAHGSDHEPPPIELVEDDGVVLSEKFSPYFILEWWPNPDCHHYEVSTPSAVLRNITEKGLPLYEFRVGELTDETGYTWTVKCVDSLGQKSSGFLFNWFEVRVPILHETEYKVGYNAGTTSITITVP